MSHHTLKSILYDLIHKHPTKSLEQIAEEWGVSASYLTRSALPDKDEVDNPDLATGCRFPLKKKPGREKLHRQLAKSIQEFGELIQAVGESIEDGTITDTERHTCQKEAYELIQAIMSLLNLLKEEKELS